MAITNQERVGKARELLQASWETRVGRPVQEELSV
jgi:hypothetical protein